MAKKQLNKNLVLVLMVLASIVMIALSAMMLHQLQPDDPAHFVALAEEAKARQEWESAVLYYSKAWECSHDAAFLVDKGQVLLDQGDLGGALRAWQEALVNEPDLIEAHTHRLKLLFDLSRLYGNVEDWRRVKESADELIELEGEKAPADLAFAHHARALAFAHLESQDPSYTARVLTELERASTLAPDAVDYAIDLATRTIEQDQVEQGEATLRALVEKHTSPGADASKVRVAYARHLARTDRIEEAERRLRESVTLAADDPAALGEARLGYARFLSQRWVAALRDGSTDESAEALFEQAKDILREEIESDPDSFEAPIQLASLYKAVGGHADALEVCEARLARGFSREGVEGARNRLLTFSLNILASEACAALALATDETAERDKRLADAERYLADAKGEYAKHPAAFAQEGRIKLARGHDRAALEAFRTADDLYRMQGRVNWDNKIRLANLHLMLKEPGAAKSVLDDVIDLAGTERGGDTRLWSLYAEVLVRNGEDDRALSIVDQILSAYPANAEARRIKASILEGRGEHERVQDLVGPGTVRSILEAKQLALEGDIEGALTKLREALDQDPANVQLASTLVAELVNRDRVKEAQAIVARALEASPNSQELQALEVWVRPGLSPEDRDRALLEVIEGEEDDYRRTIDLIGFHVRKQQYARALGLIDEALPLLIDRATPNARNATIAHHRALLKEKMRLAALLDREDMLAEARDTAADLNVDGVGGQSLLGLYHMYREEWELAATTFHGAVTAQPTDVRSLVHLGQCYQRLGRTEEALTAFERALRINPDEPLAHMGLGQLAEARGDTEVYRRALNVCSKSMSDHPWVKAGRLILSEEKDPRSAIQRREVLLEEDPDDIHNLRRLVQLCETVQDLEKADAYCRKLLTFLPDDKNLHVAVSKYYRRTGRPDESLAVVTAYAESRMTDQERANAAILVASHYLNQGDIDLVERTLLQAADLADTVEVAHSLGEFYLHMKNRSREALRWYDRTVKLAEQQQSPRLAHILASRITCLLDRSVDDLERARTCVDDLLGRFPNDPKGLLLDSEVHARLGNIDQAIASLNSYLGVVSKDPQALFQRARHHIALGQATAAIEDLETIKRNNPLALDLQPRLLLAQLYRQSGMNKAWVRELESLVTAVPTSAAALEALVNAYIIEKRFDEADRIITQQINSAPDAPDPRWYYLRGRVSTALGDHERALRDYKRGAELSGFTAKSLAAVLAAFIEAGRSREGVTYYEQHAQPIEMTPLLQSQYALLLARTGRQEQAVEVFRRAVAAGVSDASVNVEIASRHILRAFTPDEALLLFEKEPTDAAQRRANQRILVRLLLAKGRFDDAGALVDRLLATAANDDERARLHQERGDTFNLAGLPEQAREAYEESLKLNDSNWAVLNNLAYVLSDNLGEYALARPYAEQAVALHESTHTLDTLGWILVGLGEYRRAIAELNRAIRLDPGSTISYYHLGEAYRRNGEFNRASNILSSGKEIATNLGETELIARIEESLHKVSRRDGSPPAARDDSP